MKGNDYMNILRKVANVAKFFAEVGDGLASWGIGYQPEDFNKTESDQDIKHSFCENYNMTIDIRLNDKEKY